MKFDLPNVQDTNVNEKRVFVRCDFDVPLSEQSALPAGRSTINNQQSTIIDDTRLISSISTIEYLLENGATVIAAGHLGRPSLPNSKLPGLDKRSGAGKTQNSKLSLKPVAKWFAEEFPGSELIKTEINGFPGWQIKRNFYILENLRFYKEEEDNDPAFSQKLSDIADIYVNEAFGASHRKHASIVGISEILPHFAGFHIIKEVKILLRILEEPKRPLTIVVGGAKIETKLPLISKMHMFADYILVGGELAEQDKILIRQQHAKTTGNKALLLVADLNSDKSDITNMSLENFLQVISRSECVVWNGPLGKINSKLDPLRQSSSEARTRNSKLNEGDEGYSSLKLANAIIESSAYKVVGGGDTIALLNKNGLLDKFDFASVGGGAMLEFLSGESLPGLLAFQK